jgi:two-component system OmpR family response regulator
MHLLVVEDEVRLADLLKRSFAEEGHHVTTVGTLAEARTHLAGPHGADVLVVDRMLPDGDGLALVRDLRRSGDRRPALILTARDRIDERVQGLSDGADDYLGKPFALAELLARVDALGRRIAAVDHQLKVGDLEIDRQAMRVHRSGQEVRLTAQELRLLVCLAENAGRVMSKSRLLEEVWDIHHDPGTNLVEVYISYLRTKLDKRPGAGAPLIHTVRGLGYVLEDRPR